MAGNTVTPDQARALAQEYFRSVFGDLQTPNPSPFTTDTTSHGGSPVAPPPDALETFSAMSVTPPRVHSDGSGTVSMGPLRTISPDRRGEALAAGDLGHLHGRPDRFTPPRPTAERVVAGHSRAPSRSSRAAGPVHAGDPRQAVGPTIEMQGGEMVRVGYGLDAHREFRPRLATVAPRPTRVVERPAHFAPGTEGRIQRFVARANDCLSRGNLEGAQSAIDRAHVIARHARGLSLETLFSLGDTGVAIRHASAE